MLLPSGMHRNNCAHRLSRHPHKRPSQHCRDTYLKLSTVRMASGMRSACCVLAVPLRATRIASCPPSCALVAKRSRSISSRPRGASPSPQQRPRCHHRRQCSSRGLRQWCGCRCRAHGGLAAALQKMQRQPYLRSPQRRLHIQSSSKCRRSRCLCWRRRLRRTRACSQICSRMRACLARLCRCLAPGLSVAARHCTLQLERANLARCATAPAAQSTHTRHAQAATHRTHCRAMTAPTPSMQSLHKMTARLTWRTRREPALQQQQQQKKQSHASAAAWLDGARSVAHLACQSASGAASLSAA